MTTYANLAVEDDLSEIVVKTLIQKSGLDIEVLNTFGKRGNGYLRKGLKGFNAAARHNPFVVVTDLDAIECPPTLAREWFRGLRKEAGMCFAVAVREVEAWLMADRTRFAEHFAIAVRHVPDQPETAADPKETLINVMRQSRVRAFRDSIIPSRGSMAVVGPDYTGALSEFVLGQWRPHHAANRAPSLERAIERLREIE